MSINNEETTELLYEMDEKGQRVLVRSIESNQRAYLRFTNKTARPVDVWWRDFRGARRLYVRLEAKKFYDINSFVTHPWEFTDTATKEHYVINNNPVYRPPIQIGGMLYRTNWNITVSVRSLKETTLLSLALYINNINSVNALGLPRVLALELQRLIKLFHTPQIPTVQE